MEQLTGGATRSRRRRQYMSADKILGLLQKPPPSAATATLELSEHDIFNTHLECRPPSPTRPIVKPEPKPDRSPNFKPHGILAALTSNQRTRSVAGPNARPVFNHKASPGTSASAGVSIPKPHPIRGGNVRFRPHSAPVNIPVPPAAFRRRVWGLDAIPEEEEVADEVMLPPHEVVAARHPPRAACTAIDGRGRTLMGRDLRQVSNAIMRKTGFLD